MDFKRNNEIIVRNKMKKYNKYDVFDLMYFLSLFQMEFLCNYNNIEYIRKHSYTFPWLHEEIAMYKLLNEANNGYVRLISFDEIKEFRNVIWKEDSAHEILLSVKEYLPEYLNRLLPSLVEKQKGYRFNFEYFLVKTYYMFNANDLVSKEFQKKFKANYYSFFRIIVNYYFSLVNLYIEYGNIDIKTSIKTSEFFEKFSKINEDLVKSLPFLESLTIDIEDYRKKQLSLLEKTNWDFYNCFNYIRCKPIIRIDEFIACPLPQVLVKAYMFYIYNEFTYGSNEKRELLGKEYEKYIYTILKNTEHKESVQSEISYLGKKSSDVVLFSSEEILFIECKFKSIPFDYRNIENLTKKEDLIIEYASALNQIVTNFDDLNSNKIPELPKDILSDNIFGIVLIQEMANIPKSEIVDYYFENYESINYEKDFIMKHIHFVEDVFFQDYVLNENYDFFKILHEYLLKDNSNDILELSSYPKKENTWVRNIADKIYEEMFK